MNSKWRIPTFFCLVAILFSGCRIEVPNEAANKTKKKKVAVAKPKVSKTESTTPQTPTTFRVRDDSARTSRPERDFTPQRDRSGYDSSPSSRGMGTASASSVVQKVSGVINETVELGPTLVVWCLDVTDTALSQSMGMSSEIRSLYDRLANSSNADVKAKDRLLSAVVAFGHDVEFAVDEPTSDKTAITAAIDKLKADKVEKEMTFTAVKQAVEKYLPFRTQKQYQLMIVIVTDEAGDDGEVVDGLIPTLDKYAIPVYAIGNSAPFGKATATPAMQIGFQVKKEENSTAKSHQGPESRHIEFVDIPSLSGGFDSNNNSDSGFGPFHLEYLCRGSGGAFLSRGSGSGAWSSRGSMSSNSETMQKYAPDYISEAEYQSQVNKNAAKMALLNAAKLPRVEKMMSVRTDFPKRNEVAFTKDVTNAQHIPAKIMPAIEELYQTLLKGEKDRDKLTHPRWQAAYDLALGQVSVLKANVEGYNEMLAQVKRKSSFKNESSSTWVLMPADSIEVQSVLDKLAKKGRGYLERVVAEHPNTPWANIAKQDLTAHVGWKWEER